MDDIDPVMFYGVNNSHLQILKSLYPKLRITARGNVMRILGDEEELAMCDENIERLKQHLNKYNSITEEDIIDIIKGGKAKADGVKGAVVYNISGHPVKSRSAHQQMLVDAFREKDMMFAVGPAGTGKTYLSIALAVKALKEKEVKRIILSRPAVEAGEKLGFLPGDMKEKIDPYLQPLYDALEDMIPAAKLQEMMERHVIQIAPLAFMRGRTLNDAVVILDEATSALDAKTEFDVVNAIKERGITCIVVAHRLSTVRDCDQIIVLGDGVAVERGTHEELYAKGGLYTRLISND